MSKENETSEEEKQKVKQPEPKKGQDDCPPQMPGKGRCPKCGEKHV